MSVKSTTLLNPMTCERRKYPRREAHLFTVFRRLLKKEVGAPQIGYTRDISTEGVYFYTQDKVEKGDQIDLTIHLTTDWAEGGNPPKLEGKGNVLRVERTRKPSPLPVSTGVAVRVKERLAISFK